MKCVKYLLFAFNLMFAFSGLLLIITGGVVQGAYSEYLDFLGDSFFNTPVFLSVVGCIIFFVAFFGCCGAIKENQCMTLTFGVLLGIIFLMEIGAGIAAYQLKGQMNELIEKNMEKGMKNYNQEGYEGVTKTWDIIQREIRCCGAQEFRDWGNTTFSEKTNVPDSCCLSDIDGCGKNVLTENDSKAAMKIHLDGCFATFSSQIQSNVAVLGGVGIGIGFMQLIGMVAAFLLSRALKKEYETV
jgi:CD63 antigen